MKLQTEDTIENIKRLRSELENHFRSILKIDPRLTRKIVSFQNNKDKAFYRWYKYKEAFSSTLVEYFISKYNIPKGVIFDPFAGIGTTLFASSLLGYDAEGIELLPIGHEIIESRVFAQFNIMQEDLSIIEEWRNERPWNLNKEPMDINCLRITRGAYPDDTAYKIGQYLSELKTVEDKQVSKLLFFALICILESVSFTRKDGQYLRWDHRSERGNGKNSFDKGKIHQFDVAVCRKLYQIIKDINSPLDDSLFQDRPLRRGTISLYKGSCLEVLPSIKSNKYKAIITSPPYCNRYDYTRTYALEHALMGISESQLAALRQAMLSCTVENKPKDMEYISEAYYETNRMFEKQELINAIHKFFEEQKEKKKLNNNGIPRMVKGYFQEMTAVIAECFRVLEDDGYVFMVNDNVRYAGISIPVDLILSQIAEDMGFEIINILVLPQKKGNSSQQMGGFGRESLRKCVYVWRKS
ncbi:MAG TPA: site-specific DNA-methyltransferase [Planctomycetes bacterium]|nr:site-specific DNA-methyltransferase [Planctomycetota bacterium]